MNSKKMTQFYYTYAYLREDRTPYYIGKGRGRRIHSTKRIVKPPKDKSRIIFLKENLTEEEAFKHEIYMIAVFGRKDNGTGILRNLTDGGEGGSNQGTPEQRRESARKREASMTPEQLKQRSENLRKANASRTPEQRSENLRKVNAKLTPEQRSERSRKGNASKTPEQRSESARKAREAYHTKSTPEQRSERARKISISQTPEQRGEAARKAAANKTSEQRSESARKREASMTPEQRSERARKANASRTPEQRSETLRKAASQKFQCTVTGFITNAGGLSSYQKARGIDTSNRVRLS
jgi:hypothetical protein